VQPDPLKALSHLRKFFAYAGCGGRMCPFADWCEEAEEVVGNHKLKELTGVAENLTLAVEAIAAVVPTHYSSEERIIGLLDRLGKPASAQFIRNKLPEGPRIRSGDLGEILATEYVAEQTSFTVPIKRLRWKDHRNMAMRGDDVIGIRMPDTGPPLEFLKAESKSNAALAAGVVTRARTALNNDNGLPSPHALSFVADRLREAGETETADAIDTAQLKDGILPAQVEHMLFVFCGNSPVVLLKADLNGYTGAIVQSSVGIRVVTHQQFIKDVYVKVIVDGYDG
jgi:Cap4 SAVED domain